MSDNNAEIKLLRQEFEQHLKEDAENFKKQEKRWEWLLESQERALAEQRITNSNIEELTESTSGLVEAWQAADGTVKVFSVVGKFMKWCLSMGTVGISVYYGIHHLGK